MLMLPFNHAAVMRSVQPFALLIIFALLVFAPPAAAAERCPCFGVQDVKKISGQFSVQEHDDGDRFIGCQVGSNHVTPHAMTTIRTRQGFRRSYCSLASPHREELSDEELGACLVLLLRHCYRLQ